MDRAAEVEQIGAELGADARAFLRGALTWQRQGELDNCAVNTRRVLELENKPLARWAALLLALDSAELRLAGAARFTTPDRAYVLRLEAKLYPDGEILSVTLRLCERPQPSSLEWSTLVICGDSKLEWIDEVIRMLADEIEAHVGLVVELVDRGP